MLKVEVEVENLKKSWIFFFNFSRAVLFSEGQKIICLASLDVEFHKLSNCFLKMPYLFFSLIYRDSKSAVIFNTAHKHRAHKFRR